MLSIQQHETKQLADLADFLKVEIQYVSKYQNTLLELQAELPDMRVHFLGLTGPSHLTLTRLN